MRTCLLCGRSLGEYRWYEKGVLRLLFERPPFCPKADEALCRAGFMARMMGWSG